MNQLTETLPLNHRLPPGGESSPNPQLSAPAHATRWLSVLVRSAVSLGILGGCGLVFLALGTQGGPPARQAAEDKQTTVEVVSVASHVSGLDFEVNGIVVPFQEVQVSAEVTGRVTFRSENCHIGHTVKQGEVLLKIDPKDYELEIRRLEELQKQAEAGLKESDAEIAYRQRQIKHAEDELVIHQREVERVEALFKRGSLSRSESESTRLKGLQAVNQLQTEKDQLAILEARRHSLVSGSDLVQRQLEKARLDLERTEITAPIDGVITREPVERGSYVQRGGAVAMIQNTSAMEIRCSLQMKEMHWLWQSAETSSSGTQTYRIPQTPVTVMYDMEGARFKWQGELLAYDGGKIDQQTRMVPCRIRVSNPDQASVESASSSLSAPALMAGMFVTVEVHARPAVELIRIPEAAVQPGGTVWTVRAGKLHETTLKIARAGEERVIAYLTPDGPQIGDQVVVSPLTAPGEGVSVTIREAQ